MPSRSVVVQRDLGHQHLDQHLARHPVELLDRVLDLRPAPREGGDDHRVGDFVGDEAHLALRQQLGGAGGAPGPAGNAAGAGGGGGAPGRRGVGTGRAPAPAAPSRAP